MAGLLVGALLIGLRAFVVSATAQGLYFTNSSTEQLLLVDFATGKTVPDGPGLASQGFQVPSCTPSAIDTTGKWYYTLAKNASHPGPWIAIAAELVGGNIRKAYPLPALFPPQLDACDHTITADGSWHAYISAVTPDNRLVSGRFLFTWPQSDEYVQIANMRSVCVITHTSPFFCTLRTSRHSVPMLFWMLGLVGCLVFA